MALVTFKTERDTRPPASNTAAGGEQPVTTDGMVDETEPLSQPNPAIEPEPSHIAPNRITAAVLSNENKAMSLKAAAPAQSSPIPERPVPFIDSPTAQIWAGEGITREDIETAQTRLRDSGFSARMQEDPSLIRQYLPRRNVQAAHVKSFTIAERAPAGEPIPFLMGGALPDSSFEFTHFDIAQSSNVIRILPIGNTSGAEAPGEEVPVELTGEIAPLKPGVYKIEFPELGSGGSFELIVE